MTTSGQLAFANVRAHARAARLLGPEVAAHLRAVRDDAARAVALGKLGGQGDAASLRAARLARLLDDYAVLLRASPIGKGLLLALARRHEIENLKLLVRAAVRRLPAERWRRAWCPLGPLATLPPPAMDETLALDALVKLTAATPYAALVAIAASATDATPAAAEIALDRFASERLVEEAARLPATEIVARELVLGLVRERDLDSIRRAAAYGLAPELAAGAATLLAVEPDAKLLPELAAWTPADGPLGPLLPRRVMGRDALIADWDALELALRRRLRRACAAAFIGSPLRIAPGVAFLLLEEEELRGLIALAEAPGAAGDPTVQATVERALAGSALGD